MRVRVSFYLAVRDQAWIPEETIELPASADIRRLLESLAAKSGAVLMDAVLRSDGTLQPAVAILLNGSNVSLQQGLSTQLTHGDVVSVVPVVAGGR